MFTTIGKESVLRSQQRSDLMTMCGHVLKSSSNCMFNYMWVLNRAWSQVHQSWTWSVMVLHGPILTLATYISNW